MYVRSLYKKYLNNISKKVKVIEENSKMKTTKNKTKTS